MTEIALISLKVGRHGIASHRLFFIEDLKVLMTFLSLSHADLRAEALGGFDKAHEFLKLWLGIMSILINYMSEIVQEQVNFLLDQFEIRIG